MQQQSIEEFFRVKKKVNTGIRSSLPSVIRYDTPTQMELESDIDIDNMEMTIETPPRVRKGQAQISLSQEDMRLQTFRGNFPTMSNPFPYVTENTMQTEMNVTKNLEKYFNKAPKKTPQGKECSMPMIEESPLEYKKSKKYKDNHQFLNTWLHQCSTNNYSW